MLLKNSSAGWDGIHTKVVKNTYNVFSEPLLHILILNGDIIDSKLTWSTHISSIKR